MRQRLIALVLAVAGLCLLREGWIVAHSVTGRIDYAYRGLAYKLLGHVSIPGYVLTLVGGVLLVLAGWRMLASPRTRSRRRR